ncbi:MAG: hypothetical protein AAF135_00150 [Bacteroidota bacterium]
MSLHSSDKQLVAKFLDRSITPEELIEFRNHYDRDPAFVQYFKQEQKLKEGLLKGNKILQPSSSSYAPHKILTLCISLLVFLGTALYFTLNEDDAPSVAHEAIETRRVDLLTVRGGARAGNDVTRRQANIQTYQGRLKSEPDRARLHFILADLWFQAGRPDSARKYYYSGLKIDASDSFARWNLTLAYLSEYQIDTVRYRLATFMQGDDAYLKRKAEILEEKMRSVGFMYNLKNLSH